AYLPLVVGRVADALDALGRRDEAVVLLHKALADNGGADVMEEAVKRLAAWEALKRRARASSRCSPGVLASPPFRP
ncbi:MAG: hypothetical protein ACLUHG_02480, partial [Sutterella wadsworthensis]